jgi:hypothetical protein
MRKHILSIAVLCALVAAPMAPARADVVIGGTCHTLGKMTMADDKINLAACMGTSQGTDCTNTDVCKWKSVTSSGYTFGGIYEVQSNCNAKCAYPNPFTNACSCPDGFTPKPIHWNNTGGCNINWVQYLCILPNDNASPPQTPAPALPPPRSNWENNNQGVAISH